VLLTGATGYVGGRLLRALEDRGHRIRCLARKPEHLASRVASQTEVVAGDLVSGEGLAEALSGVDTAYYLVHSMGSAGGFEEEDRGAATNFGAAARTAGVRRIVYLGGLADEGRELSPHLRSRLEVGRLLRESGVPVIELRASIVIGSGSLSFEMIRSLVEHLPVLVMPRWVSMPAQPIGIDDLLAYLLEALHAEPTGIPIYEIGGADRMSYADLMREYARQRGLRRVVLPVPVLTPRLSSLWLGLVTPLYARIGRKLIDSIRHPTIVQNDAARHAFRVVPSDVRTAIARALENEGRNPVVQTHHEAAASRREAWRMQHRSIIALAIATTCLGAHTALGTEIEGVEFPNQYRSSGAQLRLNGTGLLRYRVFIKGYVAALYLGERVEPERALDDVPRRLEIKYFWSIPADAFAEITIEGMARSVDAEALERLRGRIERLNALYEDVEPGDRYSLTYVPGIGTELALNGEPKGVVEGADFSSALFAIWIGEQALDESLREQLLAKR
jgi:uncharacterized protein YbjT (DUF2867 family)